MSKQPSISYKDAGVDIDAGEALVAVSYTHLDVYKRQAQNSARVARR